MDRQARIAEARVAKAQELARRGVRPTGRYDARGNPLVCILGWNDREPMTIREAREIIEDQDLNDELGRQLIADAHEYAKSTIKPVGMPREFLEDDIAYG